MNLSIAPSRIRWEVSNFCQLRCPLCPTAQGIANNSIEVAHLSFYNFKHVVDENPCVKQIEMSHTGEIFLNPHLIQILEYAHKKGIALTVDNGANLNTAAEEVLQALVKYRVRSIFISIDGATPAMYALYRIGGDFNKVINNIKRINYYKKMHNAKFPFLTWQFIVFDYNRHEIAAAKKMAHKLAMGFLSKPSWNSNFLADEKQNETLECVGSASIFKTIGRNKSKKDYATTKRVSWAQRLHCGQLWHGPQISSKGAVVGCCHNRAFGDYGNVFYSSLNECINGEKMQYARAMLLGKRQERQDIPCSKCSQYHAMKEKDAWLTMREIYFFNFLGWIKNRYFFSRKIYSWFYDAFLKRL